MKVKYEFEISEHFEVGNCAMCPLTYWYEYENIDGYIEVQKCCPLNKTWENCPLEIVEVQIDKEEKY